MLRGRARGRGRSRGMRAFVRSNDRRLTHMMTGHPLRNLSPIPPMISISPWINLIVPYQISAATAGTTFTCTDIANSLRDTHGFRKSTSGSDRIPGFVRIFAVKIWATSSVSTASLSLECFDYLNADKEVLYRESRAAAKNQWARAGYHYPAHICTSSFNDGVSNILARVITSSTATIHFSCAFRPSLSTDLPELQLPSLALSLEDLAI